MVEKRWASSCKCIALESDEQLVCRLPLGLLDGRKWQLLFVHVLLRACLAFSAKTSLFAARTFDSRGIHLLSKGCKTNTADAAKWDAASEASEAIWTASRRAPNASNSFFTSSSSTIVDFKIFSFIFSRSSNITRLVHWKMHKETRILHTRNLYRDRQRPPNHNHKTTNIEHSTVTRHMPLRSQRTSLRTFMQQGERWYESDK